MYKRIFLSIMICILCFLMTACGPSEEKIAQAQQKYAQLVEMHNQVVEAHKNISDDSLDETLTGISEQLSGFEEYNLAEMKDEEIDALIQDMDSLAASYEEIQTKISDIKKEEDAAVLIDVPVSVQNTTSFTFTNLKLYEKDDHETHSDVLEGMEGLTPGQTLTGLVIRKDVDNTPWVLELSDTEGNEYKFEISVEEYGEEGAALSLAYDAENGGLAIENALKQPS